MAFDIVVFGSINLDLIFALDRLPGPGETVLGPDVRIQPGGKGANQAVAAALDGARVAMAGAVGRDVLASDALGGLQAAGVDLSRVVEADAATGCAAICTDPAGRNQIVVGAGANARACAHQVEDALLHPATLLLLQMEADPGETATLIHRARARNAPTVLNLAPARPLDPAALRAVSYLMVNEHEAAWLADRLGCQGTAAGLHHALEKVSVVRTLGERGCEYHTRDHNGAVPAYAVRAVDTTAAGDCFAGVFCAALVRGAPERDALTRAAVAAALCCTRPGSQGSLPTTADIDAALRQ